MAPFVLKFKGNKSFSPLSQISDAETLTRTWKVCTKVASHLEQGQRLENLSWRLWFLQIALVQADNAKQKREFKRFNKGMSDKLDKDKGRQIHELEAPNFKRTDGNDKVRLRVEEMAQHRENGTLPSNPNSRNGEANYMKGMQYTFAIDPRVKPITIKEEPGAMNNVVGGRGMMGKMRVRPMPPPPVPASAQAQQPQGGQDRNGDTTMHSNENNAAGNNSLSSDHAMDVSEDHNEGSQSFTMQDHDDALHEDEELTGHHTPTPKRTPLHRDLSNHNLNAHGPSHHPSSLPYPPHQTHDAHLLSNALVNPPGSNAQYATPPAPTAAATHVESNIIRFPTIFASDFGPTSLLCALPTSFTNGIGGGVGGGISGGGPTFHFESPNAFHSFSALGSSDEDGSQSSTVTTQGIYGPSGGPTASRNLNMSGIGVGMQNADTSFDFGVPRPTFEFPLEEMMKAEYGSSNANNNNNSGANASGNANSGDGMDELTIWDANNISLSLSAHAQLSASIGNMNAGEAALWGVQPSEINPSANSNGGSNSVTPNSNVSTNTAAGNAGNKGRQAPSATPPARSNSTYSNTSANGTQVHNPNGKPASAGISGQAVNRKRGASISVSSATFADASSNTNATASAGSPTNTATSPASASSATGTTAASGGPGSAYTGGGVGSVVPGNVGNTAPGGVKSECANCGATHTPLWRRGLNDELNCNACGLYCKLHKRARPKNLRTSHGDRAGTAWGSKPGEADMAGDPVQCHNCATMATPLWRKDDEGNTLCNALKLHGTRRPLSMKSDVIRKRSRHETEKRTSVSSIITVMTPTGSNNPQNSRRNSPTPPPSAGSISSDPEPFIGPAIGPNGVDTMAFPFNQDYFGAENDYLSGIGLGMGSDLTSFSSFGSYNVFGSDSNSSNGGMGSTNGLASPTSPTEVQHIVETTVLAGVENGGGHIAPNAKRRRMTLESNFSGSSLAHTSGGANSAHSSPTGLGQQPSNNSPSYFMLDAGQSNNNNNNNNMNNNSNLDGNASPTRSTFASNSPGQTFNSTTGVTTDFYGYPIHPPMAPLHPPSLMHPHSMMWGETPLHHTPTQSSMGHARSHSQSHSISRSPNHSRRHSHSHSRSNSQHITMPLYLYDGGVSSRSYETGNASTPTPSGITSNNSQAEDELFGANFHSDLFNDHSASMDDGVNHLHYGPTNAI